MSDPHVPPWWLATAAYAALTVAFTWPLVTRVTSALPHDALDPALNTAILSWNAHAVPLTAGWWNAPMFWPMSGALVLSEHLLGVSLVASPVQWLGADPVIAYNIVFLLSFPLCALAAHALAFTLVKRHDVACLAGCIFGFSPYRVSELAHSGYEPPHYQVLKIGLRLDDGGMIDELARGHSFLVAVDHGEQFDRWAAVVGPHPVAADEGGWRLYRVAAGAEVAGPAGGARLPIRSVAANFQNDAVSRMLDGDPTTAWSTGRIQTGGEELLIDLGRPSEVADVRLTLGPFFADFPRRLSVECSVDRQQWDVCWRGSAAALALRATLDDPLIATMIIPVAGRAARYVRLRQTGVDAANGWAVAEIAVFGR